MQSEEAVEVNHRVARNIDRRPHGVVGRLAVRDHDIQSVRRAALEDDHQPLVARAGFDGRVSRASQESRESQPYPQLPARRCEEILDE